MMCNCARPYSPANMSIEMPVFSRTRPDMIFQKGDVVEFFTFPKLRPVAGSWKLSRQMVAKSFLEGEAEICMDQSVRIVIPTANLKPGFYDVAITVMATATNKLAWKTGFGYRLDEIPYTDSRPADFEAFWAKAKKKLDSVPLNPSETLVREMTSAEVSKYNVEEASIPEEYDPKGKRCDKVKLFKVQFDSPGGKRMYGWLARPAAEGKYPAVLVLPGAGCGKVPAPVEHARHGYVALMLQVHGMDVDLEKYQEPAGYLKIKGGAPEDEYYYNVFLACAQAVKYLAARPDVDAGRMAVAGGSQGGLLSIVTAALCPEIKAVCSSICYYGYWPWRAEVEALNAKSLDGKDQDQPPFDAADPKQRNRSYYDAANFAPMVKAPTIMGACLNDTPSPPTTVYFIFKRLGASKKEIFWSPNTNHDMMLLFERGAWEFLDREFNLKR